MAKREAERRTVFERRHSSFGFDSSFEFRHSNFPSSSRRVPLPLELGDLAAAVDLAGELPVAEYLAFGDGVVDDVVDGEAGEGEDAVEAGLDDAAFAGGLVDRRGGQAR